MRECIGLHQEAILYLWKPKCRGSYSLQTLQKKCDSLKIELFIVAEYYDKMMQVSQGIKRPIFGIDTRYYQSNLTSKYVLSFIRDLISNPDTNTYRDFYYFKAGVFHKAGDDLNSILNRDVPN